MLTGASPPPLLCLGVFPFLCFRGLRQAMLHKGWPLTRHWVFTNFKLNFDYNALVDLHAARYVCYGVEVCPKTKKEHHQGWISFSNPNPNPNPNHIHLQTA